MKIDNGYNLNVSRRSYKILNLTSNFQKNHGGLTVLSRLKVLKVIFDDLKKFLITKRNFLRVV